jgi:hypothetical protein
MSLDTKGNTLHIERQKVTIAPPVYVCVCIYICVCVCMYVYLCVCERDREREREYGIPLSADIRVSRMLGHNSTISSSNQNK